VIYDSGKVSLEHLLLSWYPSERGSTSVWSLVEPTNPESIIDFCITQLKAQGPSRTRIESKQEEED